MVVRERRIGVGGSGGLRALTVGTAGVEGVRKSVISAILDKRVLENSAEHLPRGG